MPKSDRIIFGIAAVLCTVGMVLAFRAGGTHAMFLMLVSFLMMALVSVTGFDNRQKRA